MEPAVEDLGLQALDACSGHTGLVARGGTIREEATAGRDDSALTLAVHQQTPLDALRNMTYGFLTFHGGVGAALGAYARGVGTVTDPDRRRSGYVD